MFSFTLFIRRLLECRKHYAYNHQINRYMTRQNYLPFAVTSNIWKISTIKVLTSIHKSFKYVEISLPDSIQEKLRTWARTTHGEWNKCSHIIIYFTYFSPLVIAANGHQFSRILLVYFPLPLSQFAWWFILSTSFAFTEHLRHFISRVRKSKWGFH